MGHKTDAMDRRYGVVEDDDVVEAVERLDSEFRKRMGSSSTPAQPAPAKSDLTAAIQTLPADKRALVESLIKQLATQS